MEVNLKKQYNITQWNEYKLNYWAIPKCANTAVKTALSNLKYKDKMTYSKVKWVHNPDNILYIDRQTAKTNDYKNFTVTRHPYDRFLSLYKDQGLRRPMFKDIDPNIDSFISQLENYDLQKDPHTKMQCDYIFDDDKLLVDTILDISQATAFLEKYNLTLNFVNKTKEIDIKLTDKQKEKIFNLYKKDFLKLGYKND